MHERTAPSIARPPPPPRSSARDAETHRGGGPTAPAWFRPGLATLALCLAVMAATPSTGAAAGGDDESGSVDVDVPDSLPNVERHTRPEASVGVAVEQGPVGVSVFGDSSGSVALAVFGDADSTTTCTFMKERVCAGVAASVTGDASCALPAGVITGFHPIVECVAVSGTGEAQAQEECPQILGQYWCSPGEFEGRDAIDVVT